MLGFVNLGGRWVTIPQPSAPQADALPIELRPPCTQFLYHEYGPRVSNAVILL